MSRGLAALAALALVAAGAPRAEEGSAPARVRVALDRLRPAGVSPAFAGAVEDGICAALGRLSDLEVVCPSDLAASALLARNAAVLGECASDDCIKRVEAMKVADRRVVGTLEKAGSGIVLSLQVTGPAGAGPRLTEKLPEDLDAVLAKLPALVRKLFP